MNFDRKILDFIIVFLSLIIVFVLSNDFAVASEQTLAGIIHFPVKNTSEGQKILIEAKIEDPNIKVQYMRLYYRQKGQSSFQFLEMEEQLNNYVIELPASEVKLPGIEYFIMAVLNNRSMISSPSSNPYYAPYEITITPSTHSEKKSPEQDKITKQTIQQTTSGAQIETVILSPEPNERVALNDVVIAVSFLGDVDKLDLESIRLFIDEKDFSAKAEITKNIISYVPQNLSSGAHQVRIELADKQGNRFNEVTWRFSIILDREKIREEKEGVPLSGNMFVEYKNEKFSDSTLTTSNLGANFRGKYGPIEYHGTLVITSREKSQFQPRNRFLLDVGTSWLGIKLGDTTPRFNELMLWGKRVRGIEAYLKLGFINFEFVQGETNRKVKGIPYKKVIIDSTTGKFEYVNPNTDSTESSTTGIYRYGTFQQNLTAGRLSFGGEKNFQFGINLVKVRDDTSTSTYGSQPKDNLVIGPDILFALDNHRIELKTSAAFSLLANDISGGAIKKADLDSAIGDIPFDPSKYKKFFILNTSLIPLDPSRLTSLAYQASFKFNYFNNNINFIYKSIGAEYYSLANNYLRKDIQGFSLYDRIQLHKNQLFLNLGYDKYVEGLSYENDEAESTEPTDYTGLNIGVSFYPRSQHLPRININWKNYNRNDGLDTTMNNNAVNYQNSDVSVQLGYDVQFFDLNHTFSISYIATNREDGFKRTHVNLSNDIQMFSLRTVYQIPLTTVISFATNQNNAGGGLYGFKYNMMNLSANYYLLNRRLNLRGGLNFTSAITTAKIDSLGNQPVTSADYKRIAFDVGGNFQITKQHSLVFDMSFINFDDKKSKAYKDSIIRFRYEFRY